MATFLSDTTVSPAFAAEFEGLAQAFPAKPQFSRGAGGTRTFAPRPNKFGGRCIFCTGWVGEGQGLLAGKDENGGKFGAKHGATADDCPRSDEVVYEGDAGVVTLPVDVPAPARAVVPDGRYTVSFEDGTHRTLRVRTQAEHASFMPNRQVVGYLSGSDNDTDYTSFGHVTESGTLKVWTKHQGNTSLVEAWKVLVGEPGAASKAYAQESGCCGVCGRTLTTPESIAAGIGPECAKRVSF